MPRPDLRSQGRFAPAPAPAAALGAFAPWVLLALLGATAAAAEPQPFRFAAPIRIETAAPFVELAVPVEAYAHSRQADLGDLRLVDAADERVPFARLAPRSTLLASEREREAILYPLPARPAANGVWTSPVEVEVEGDRITVRRRGGGTTGSTALAAGSGAGARPGGWLVDTGERRSDEPAPRALRLRWSGPAEFSATYAVETSDDLRAWRQAGSGQLLALQSSSGPLVQARVAWTEAPASAGRFVRLVWLDPESAPTLTGATGLLPERHRVAVDAPAEIAVVPSAAVSPRRGERSLSSTSAGSELDPAAGLDAASAGRALIFDLGGALPIVDLQLRFGTGTRVAPLRLSAKSRPDEAWRDLGAAVFYRLERSPGAGGLVDEAPAIDLATTARWIRVVPDERAAAVDPAGTRLVVHAQLARLVFTGAGREPLRLLVGSADATPSALPLATLVPRPDEERPRFGRAVLGAFQEVESVARAAESEARTARLRPWALWSVLLVGVAVLAVMVVRLARAGSKADASGPG